MKTKTLKRLLSVGLTSVMVISALGTATVSAKQYGDYKYSKLADGTIKIEEYNGKKSDTVKIPDKVNGKKVSACYTLGTFTDRLNHTTKKVVVPRYMRTIGNFDNFDRNIKISVNKNNKKYCSVNGMVMSKSKKTLYYMPKTYGAEGHTTISIPSTVVNLNSYAVKYKASAWNPLEITLKLPKSLKEIRKDAFSDMYGLKKVKLPSKLKFIGKRAFMNTGIKEITVPKSVKTIEAKALGYNYYNYPEPEEGATLPDDWNKTKDFTIKGYSGTAAEEYANKNGFYFVSLD